MKSTKFAAFIIAVAAVGCAAQSQPETAVETSAEALTVQQCTTQRDTCLTRNPLFGFFTCPLQYTQCVATASNGVPAEVASAITDAAACAQTQATCLRSANTPAKVLTCTQAEATCVAQIVDARLPPVVTDTAKCIDDSVTCIRAAESAGDLAACAETLQQCAIDTAVSVLPPDVGQAVQDVGQCLAKLRTCTEQATTPAQLTACGQTEARCVATGLGVTLPPVVDGAVKCAETAATCTLNATSAAAVGTCASNLVACDENLATPNVPPTCEELWTQCLVRNPFAFLQCAADLATCRNGSD